MNLFDYAKNVYSQFGEDGIIEEIFKRIKCSSSVCVEFGASDGNSCSNTKNLWTYGWTGILIESELDLCLKIEEQLTRNHKVKVINKKVKSVGPDSIDSILYEQEVHDVDFMSIDIDGFDYYIFETMETKPRVICIEYNQSIPPQFSIRQKTEEASLGASAKSLIELAEVKGYSFIGMTKANLFFVVNDEFDKFDDLDCDLLNLFFYDDLMYLASDYMGRPFAVGNGMWGFSGDSFFDETVGDGVNIIGPYWHLITVLEKVYGRKSRLIPNNTLSPASDTPEARRFYKKEFEENNPLIIIDISNQSKESTFGWLEQFASRFGYRSLRTNGLLVFLKVERV